MRTKDGVGIANFDKNPRADSFSLYMNAVGDLILKNLVPKKKLTINKEHFETIKDSWLQDATYE